MKYRAKPIEVEAKQFNGSLMSAVEIEEWTKGRFMVFRNYGQTKLHNIDTDELCGAGVYVVNKNGVFEQFNEDEFNTLFEFISDPPKRGRPKVEAEE